MRSTSWGPSPRAAARPARRRRSTRHRRTRPPPELRAAGLSPRKALGQHFLTSPPILRRIAEAADLSSDEDVIEVGAGLGGLTAQLAARARSVVAIELDETLARHLERRFAGGNVHVLQGDALTIQPAEALAAAGGAAPFVVAGNLPYNVAQPLLRHFLEARPPPRRLVVMVQAEVAESIVARPGAMSLLSVCVQVYGQPRLLFRVAPSAFYPPPKVRSALVRIDLAPAPRVAVEDLERFFRIVRAGFGTRRKQLRNALAHGLGIAPQAAAELLRAAGIEPTLRAQDLTLEAWAGLARAWSERGGPEGGP